MSVRDSNQNTGAAAPLQQTENKTVEAPRAPSEDDVNTQSFGIGGISGWSGIGTGLEFHVDQTMGIGRLYEAQDAFKNSIEEDVRKKNKIDNLLLDFILVDSESDERVALPVAIMTAKIKGQQRVAYFPIVIDLNLSEQRESDVEIGREHIKIRRLPSQLVNQISGVLYEYVSKHFPGHKISDAIGAVLPPELDLKEPQRVYSFITNGINACGTLLTLDANAPDLNVAAIPDHRTLTATTRLIKNPGVDQQLINEAGRPIRGDLRTTLSTPGSRAQNGEREIYPRMVSQAAGYFDIQWNPYDGNRDSDRTVYTGAYVNTHFSTPQRNSIGGIGLAMYASFNIFKDSLARYSLAPDSTNEDKEAARLQDIGLLNIEAEVTSEPGPVTDLDAAGTRPSDVRKYIDRLVHPVIDYHMAIDESGPDTWRMWAFLDAAYGGKESLSNILTSFNELTNGNLKEYWGGKNPFTVVSVRPQGTYNQGGQVQPLARLDYVAHFALNTEDSRAVQDWQTYLYDMSIDEDVRKHHLHNLVKSVVPGAKIDGWTYIVEVDPDFIDAFIQAMGDAGLKVNFVAPGDRELRDRYTRGGARNAERQSNMERYLREAHGRGGRDDRDDRSSRGGFFNRRR